MRFQIKESINHHRRRPWVALERTLQVAIPPIDCAIIISCSHLHLNDYSLIFWKTLCILLFEKPPLCSQQRRGFLLFWISPLLVFLRGRRESIHTPAVFVALINKPTLSLLLLRLQVLSPLLFWIIFLPPLKKNLFFSLWCWNFEDLKNI